MVRRGQLSQAKIERYVLSLAETFAPLSLIPLTFWGG